MRCPELFRLLANTYRGDTLLVEQVDRLSTLNGEDWEKLTAELQARKVRVVAFNLPASWMLAKANDETTARMIDALNGIMLDLLAAITRKDYTDRRRRQEQGILKAKAEGACGGGKEDTQRNAAIMKKLNKGYLVRAEKSF